jgi:2,4-dienoyl-CoA reductase-like NADH-dependent reductase (Old Yellow Enzyme family)
MSLTTDVLYRPLKLKSLSLPNRIVMAPMTREMAPAGVPGASNAEYYRRRAAGGVGLILTEGTLIDRPAAANEANVPYFHGKEALAGWQSVRHAVHEVGGRIGPQLWHTGSLPGQHGWEPPVPVESPSGLIAAGKPRGVAMSDEAIADTIAAFAQAASDAKSLGFDVVELHGAHGYLIDQFFWQETNVRNDRYGGATLPERARFASEIISAVRMAVGPDFPIIIRLSQWKQQDYTVRLASSPKELEAWLTPLTDAGADIFHCSQRRFWEPEFPDVDGDDGLNFAGWAKKLTGATTISVGSVGLAGDFFGLFTGQGSSVAGIDKLIDRMSRDEFDLIAVGRALISDPLWAEKIRNGHKNLTGFEPAMLAELV